jgi:hypothetical protein
MVPRGRRGVALVEPDTLQRRLRLFKRKPGRDGIRPHPEISRPRHDPWLQRRTARPWGGNVPRKPDNVSPKGTILEPRFTSSSGELLETEGPLHLDSRIRRADSRGARPCPPLLVLWEAL